MEDIPAEGGNHERGSLAEGHILVGDSLVGGHILVEGSLVAWDTRVAWGSLEGDRAYPYFSFWWGYQRSYRF